MTSHSENEALSSTQVSVKRRPFLARWRNSYRFYRERYARPWKAIRYGLFIATGGKLTWLI